MTYNTIEFSEFDFYKRQNSFSKRFIVEDVLDYWESILEREGESKIYGYSQFDNKFSNTIKIEKSKKDATKLEINFIIQNELREEFIARIPISSHHTYTMIKPLPISNQKEFTYLITTYSDGKHTYFKYSIISPHYFS